MELLQAFFDNYYVQLLIGCILLTWFICRMIYRKKEKELQKKIVSLKAKESELAARKAKINDQVRLRFSETVIDLSRRDYLAETPVFSAIRSHPDPARLTSALTQDMRLRPPFNISAQIKSQSGELYQVDLYSCTCKDHSIHRKPCKHMYRLASEVGALLAYDSSALEQRVLALQQKADSLKSTITRIETLRANAAREKNAVQKIISETSQSYPWLAALYADCLYVLDDQLEQALRQKYPPANASADKVKRIKQEKRRLQAQCKALEYQLHFYETLFPWLEDFKEIPPLEAYTKQTTGEPGSEYETLRSWLSPLEYQGLSPAEKYQLALDRYKKRNKGPWELGVEYERYIGYLCEQRGYRVDYTGAKLGLEDMGRDLILSKNGAVYIIQCKRWAKEKTIHEKHIFQLFGSCVLYGAQNPEKDMVQGVFVTTTSLSPLARQCAERLGILFCENTPYKDYPMIKCNVSKSGEKIYHLPFDQQYDCVVITPERGEFFASTVAEAEQAGFRRAWRHQHF